MKKNWMMPNCLLCTLYQQTLFTHSSLDTYDHINVILSTTSKCYFNAAPDKEGKWKYLADPIV